ncbi:MAG: leucine-rich repeat domain-containing protein, partial [Clostridiales bacterium]|nr:leucine-rich repeat domain-containing protein [Clostridiales bacterium]
KNPDQEMKQMPLVPAICTQCGARLNVDSSSDAAICKYCGTPFVVEKAVNLYSVSANNVYIIGGASEYEIIAGTLKNYKGSSVNVTVPPEAKVLQSAVFSGMRALESATLPKSVTTLESMAFLACTKLKSVSLPDTITEIGEKCFSSCQSLPSVVWPKSCKTIKYQTFSDCQKLSQVKLQPGLEQIQSEAFMNCFSLKSIAIPDTVSELGVNLFKNCKSLESVKLPAGLQTIPIGFFYGCESLKSIELPSSLTCIESMAFQNSGLESVDLQCGVKVKPNAFYGCASLQNVHLAKDVDLDPDYVLHRFDNSLRLIDAPFRNCKSLQNVRWDKWVKRVDFYFFDPEARINKRGIPFF